MDNGLKEQIAAFRYSLISPIVNRQSPMAPGEIKNYLEETAKRTYTIPGSQRQTISVRSLERYMMLYRKGGWEALRPQDRDSESRTSIPDDILQKAFLLRQERPERTVEKIIFLLEEEGLAPKGNIATSTLSRHFRKAGLSRQELLQNQDDTKAFKRREAEDLHMMWQFDYKHGPYLPDPKNPKQRKKAILFAIIDDYSRIIPHAQFYWDEKLPRMEDSLKKAILKHGIPEQFYCDNGAAFSSLQLQRICGKLGIHLSHSRPYRPQGRGKIERWFEFVDTSFMPEAYQEIEQGKITSLMELNLAFTAWLDGFYHQRKHGTTNMTPMDRANSSTRETRHISMERLTDVFLWEEERKVDKTGCIKMNGNTYEVDGALCGKRICVRYDPFDLTVLKVFYQDKSYGNAIPYQVHSMHHPSVKADVVPKKAEHETSVSFFALAEKKRQETFHEPLSFAAEENVK